MGYSIITPENSFVRFGETEGVTHCIHGEFKDCLPVYADDDVYFQFVARADTSEEADALCTPGQSGLEIGLVRECEQEGNDVDFTGTPERYRLDATHVLYNWQHGLQGMAGFYEVGDCFKIRASVGVGENVTTACSNCFIRIGNDCFTSVIEYENEENFAGFNYCNAGAPVEDTGTSCEPTVIQFSNKSTLTIPYTALLQSLYGDVPTVQVWIDDGSGSLVNMGITATLDTYPPTVLNFDFGGPATGIIIIR
jgi:hypothetical protein